MNPRQRRGVILIALSVVGAVAVFVSVSNYVAQVRSQVGPETTVLRLVRDAQAFEPVTAEMVEPVAMPQRWVPEAAMTNAAQLLDMVAGTALPAGSLLQTGMLVPRPQIEPGQREIAVLVDAETGVAGKITPGSQVDIYATFPGNEELAPLAAIVVQDAMIIGVDPATTKPTQEEGTFAEREVVPVTFAVSVAESLQIAYVESFAQEVRLALRSPVDREELPREQRRYQPLVGTDFGDDELDNPSPEPAEEPES